jgi:hypothetical protein
MNFMAQCKQGVEQMALEMSQAGGDGEQDGDGNPLLMSLLDMGPLLLSSPL